MVFQAHLVFSLLQLWNQPLLQGALVPFTEEWYLETKIWVVSVLIATGDSLLIGLFSVQIWRCIIHSYTLLCLY